MDQEQRYTFGDHVVHADRPEWGVGRVLAADQIIVEGATGQRLRIRFDRGGLKTLTTPGAKLTPAPATNGESDGIGGGWLGEIAQKTPEEIFSAIPEAALDPFASLGARLQATLDLYRFTADGAPLIDWAAAQSGLADPLSKFSRHELEQHFRRFDRVLEAHLADLVSQIRRKSPALLQTAMQSAPARGRAALQRLSAKR